MMHKNLVLLNGFRRSPVALIAASAGLILLCLGLALPVLAADTGGVGSIPWCSKPSRHPDRGRLIYSRPLTGAECSASIGFVQDVPLDFGPLAVGFLQYVSPVREVRTDDEGNKYPTHRSSYLYQGSGTLKNADAVKALETYLHEQYGLPTTVEERGEGVSAEWVVGFTRIWIAFRPSGDGRWGMTFLPLTEAVGREVALRQEPDGALGQCDAALALLPEYERACEGKPNERYDYGVYARQVPEHKAPDVAVGLRDRRQRDCDVRQLEVISADDDGDGAGVSPDRKE